MNATTDPRRLLTAPPSPLLLTEQCYTTRREFERAWFYQAYLEDRKEWAWIRASDHRHIPSFGPPIPLPAPSISRKHILIIERQIGHVTQLELFAPRGRESE